MTSYETLIVERRGNVGWLIFNRPDAMNSHNLKMLEELPGRGRSCRTTTTSGWG